MKVKIFTDYYEDKVELRVNDFIKDKKVIDIKFSTTHSYIRYSCCIIYEDLYTNEKEEG